MTQRIGGIIIIVLLIGGVGYYAINQNSGSSAPTVTTPTVDLSNAPSYTLLEVSTHTASSDCWMAIDGRVYDVTQFIASGQHNPEILKGCGQDATQMFAEERKHSRGKAQTLLTELVIGTLKV